MRKNDTFYDIVWLKLSQSKNQVQFNKWFSGGYETQKWPFEPKRSKNSKIKPFWTTLKKVILLKGMSVNSVKITKSDIQKSNIDRFKFLSKLSQIKPENFRPRLL